MKHFKYWQRVVWVMGIALVGVSMLLTGFSQAWAWDEENIEYFDPLDPAPLASRQTYSPTVSSIHFDLVGALAIAAGFSITDAATIQAYTQGSDSGNLPTLDPVYTFDAAPENYPTAPPIGSVMTSTYCPSPSTTAPTISIGSTNLMTDCIACFTSRFGPYGTFFHEPHANPSELGAVRDWAFGASQALTGTVIFGYSSTARSMWQGIANIYASTPCFISQTVRIDTGSIQPGSLPALGIYLHSLGDNWSHQECIAAADEQELLFAAHILPSGPNDPLWACRWTSHDFEFGDPQKFPDSQRTFDGILALYQALSEFAAHSERPIYRPIPLNAEDNHLYEALYEFVHTSTAMNPAPRRQMADELRTWALQTRAADPQYRLARLYLAVVAH